MLDVQATNGTERISDRQLEVVMQIARIATEDVELHAMLARIVDAVREALGWQFVAFASIDEINGRFVCEAVSGAMPSLIHVGYSRELGSGVVGHVAATGKPILLDDVRDFPGYVETADSVRSELCVPVVHRGELLGVINAESVHLGTFRGQMALLETIAGQVAGAIAGARLHRELARRAAVLELMSEVAHTALETSQLADVAHRIASYVQRRFSLAFCSLLLATEDGDALVASAYSGNKPLEPFDGLGWLMTRGIVGRAFHTGLPQFVPDVAADPDYVMADPGIVAEFAVPIHHQEHLLGVLNMESIDAGTFDVDARAALCAIAGQVAGAIHMATVNGRLGQALRLVEQQSADLAQANAHLAIANDELEKLSLLDGLTGVANRRRFDAALDSEWRRARRHGQPLSLLLIDVDHFKSFNDEYGHLAGDDALRRIAATLQATLTRADDLVARFGGEEFAVLLPAASHEDALRCSRHLLNAVSELALPHARSPIGRLSISLGGATALTDAGGEARALVEAADQSLYRAKREGRNCAFVD